jgi:putative ABC transport system permease protein
MVPVARRNLFSEKGRFAMSVTGVAFAVLLVLVVLAVYRGFSRTGETFQLLPGDLWITQQGTTDPFHSLSLLAPTDLSTAREVPGVDTVIPVVTRQMSFQTKDHEASARVMGIGLPTTAPVSESFKARYLPTRGSMAIDDILSRKEGLKEGDTVDISGMQLRIGQVQPASSEAFQPFAFVNYEDAAQIVGIGDLVNFGMVALKPGTGAAGVARTIEARDARLRVFTQVEFAHAIRKEIDESFLPIIAILLAIGFTVGGAVVGLTIYTATIERSREFGVMKAVGASAGFLYRIVASQSAILTALGFSVGFVGALVVARLANDAVPDFTTDFRAGDAAAVLVGTGVMAFVASLVPVRRLNGIDPAMVFRA